MPLVRRLRALFRKGKLDADMSEEMRTHLDLETQHNLARGMSPDEARYAAQRSFGGVEQAKEQCRDERVRGFGWLEQLVHDLRYAARALRKSPVFTLVAGFTLALGIGLVAVQFSFISGAIFRGLPFERSERLMSIYAIGRSDGATAGDRLREFQRWREQQKSFASLAVSAQTSIELSGSGFDARYYKGAAFSAGLVELLGVRPVLGRSFLPDDETPNAPPVVLLSHRVWRDDFGSDPAVVGRAVRLRGKAATIIGVMPEGFGFPKKQVAWVNLRFATSGSEENLAVVRVIGRLRDDTTLAKARAEFDVIVQQAVAATATGSTKGTSAARAEIVPLGMNGASSRTAVLLYSLLGMVGGVLAIACLNVANLLSARALQRGHELAVRSSLGASRGRLIRQMLSESTLLALLGAAGGLLLAHWGVTVLNVALRANTDAPYWLVIELDYRVFAATAGLTLVVGILTGLGPALRATRGKVTEMLKDAGLAGHRLGRVNRGLMIAQVALSCAIVLSTSVLVQAARTAAKPDLPFDGNSLLSATVRLTTAQFDSEVARRQFYTALLEQVRALPGVASATLTSGYPAKLGGIGLIQTKGGAQVPGTSWTMVSENHAAPGFLRELGVPLREGRDFLATDRPGGERVAIVNESFARRYWPGEAALGKTFRLRKPDTGPVAVDVTVVGVAADLPTDRVDGDDSARYHVPISQDPNQGGMLLLRSHQDPRAHEKSVRQIVRSLSPDVPVSEVKLLSTQIAEREQTLQSFGGLALAFGLSGLFLAVVGVYGVAMFGVQQRTREFGVRVALGGTGADLLRLVLGQGAKQLAIGLGAGALLGWAGSRPLIAALVKTAPPSAGLYVVVLAIVALAVLFALWLPARRASRIDPMVALRSE